jgi:exodeoxyribonuclease V alpha subunit
MTTTEDVQIVEGTVERVLYSNPANGYAVVEVAPFDGQEKLTVTGALGAVALDDSLRISGSFVQHKKFGRQFQAASAQPASPRTEYGIVRYLAGPRVEGLGIELARRVVAKFGTKTLEILDREPERLREVEGIGRKRLKAIRASWRSDTARREGLVFLHTYGIGPALAERILDALGADALAGLRTNPYIMIERVSGVGFKTADAMARSLGIAADAPGRLRAGLLHTLDLAAQEGHVCLPGRTLLADASALLDVDEPAIRARLRDLVEEHRAVIAAVRSPESATVDYRVYSPYSYEAEREAAERLIVQIGEAGSPAPAPVELDLPAMLSDEQREAVRLLFHAKVAVLTGGPGVGKTTVLRTLTRNWNLWGRKLALACPTGRAAKRLEDVVGQEAKTLHRLLRFDPKDGRFSQNGADPLEADVVVVDESSMVDLALFVHLLRALRPEAQLLLVGDADQLPSVGPGRILGDVIDSGCVPVARLTKVFRQSQTSDIVTLAHDILRGTADPELARGQQVVFVEENDASAGAQRIRDLVVDRLPTEMGLDPVRDIQVLTPTNKGTTGSVELNKLIQEARAPSGQQIVFGDYAFRRGDRVMQIRNDYDRDLFNGDMGAVVDLMESTGTVVCEFDGKKQEYSRKQLQDLQLAWAISVHKSQGGEFPAVVLAIYPHHFMLLRRQVLYTAVTRAKRLLVLVGSRGAFRQAVSNNKMAARYTHLADRLRGHSIERWFPPPAEAAEGSAAPGDGD